MCILAIQYKTVRGAPILVAHNREEYFDRPTQGPKIQSGKPRAICGIDRKAGGTWFGVNQHGLFVTVANRPKATPPLEPRSRGILCRELLTQTNAQDATDYAAAELRTGAYAGANFICADADYGYVVYGGNHVAAVELTPGLHIMTNGNIDDRMDDRQEFVRRQLTLQKIDSSVAFLAVASRAFARKPDSQGRHGVVMTGGDFGTVSSTLLSLPARIQNAVYQYAAGPPSDTTYDDCSALLRQVLSTDKSKEARERELAEAEALEALEEIDAEGADAVEEC
ncbi:MAG: NRDE family protein [Planctomycetota bacterium]|nr:NRDE family protein [Planctomycetota bacterium]